MVSIVIIFAPPLLFGAFILIALFLVSLPIGITQVIQRCMGRIKSVQVPLCVTAFLRLVCFCFWRMPIF